MAPDATRKSFRIKTNLVFTVAHNCQGKIFLLTAKSISPRQNQFRKRKINLLSHRKINFSQSISQYGKINFTHGKINFTQDRIIFTHGKINFTHGKNIFTTAKSFWLSRSRDIGSQSAMGVKPTGRSSSWCHESCFARTVEVVCYQQQIFACSMDKVSRNWLIDVFKHTKYILPFLFRESLTWNLRSL